MIFIYFIQQLFFFHSLTSKQNFIVSFLITNLSLFSTTIALVYWAYSVKNAPVKIFFILFFLLLFSALFFVPFYYIVKKYHQNKNTFLLTATIATYIFRYYLVYHLPKLIASNFILFTEYPLFFYAEWPLLLWPLPYINQWIFAFLYYFAVAIILHYKKIYVIFFYTIYLSIGIHFFTFKERLQSEKFITLDKLPEEETDTTKKIDLFISTLLKYKDSQKILIGPEGYFDLIDETQFQIIEHLIKKNNLQNLTIFFGAHYKKDTTIFNSACSIKNGTLSLCHHKTHAIPFAERGNPGVEKESYIQFDEKKHLIKICSEFLCQELECIDENIICLASDQWTNIWYLHHFSHYMHLQTRIKGLKINSTIVYCTPNKPCIHINYKN